MTKRSLQVRIARGAALVTGVLSLLLSGSRAARADVASCAQAHASGQREAKSGHLKRAAELFASCRATDGCPETIRAECLELSRDTEKSLPTVIFAVTDAEGNDLVDVRVYSTDALLAERLDGRAVALDPGEHHFRFVLAAGPPLRLDVLVREGEKNRIVSVRAPALKGPVAEPAKGSSETADATRSPEDAGAAKASPPPAFWIAAGVAGAALTSFTVFALLGHGRQAELDECSPSCPASQRHEYDAMRQDYLIADISLGVAAISAGAATWFLLSNRSSSAAAAEPPRALQWAKRVTVTPLLSTPGVSVILSERF